jgi:hypothetical protein
VYSLNLAIAAPTSVTSLNFSRDVLEEFFESLGSATPGLVLLADHHRIMLCEVCFGMVATPKPGATNFEAKKFRLVVITEAREKFMVCFEYSIVYGCYMFVMYR